MADELDVGRRRETSQNDEEASTASLSASELDTADFQQMHMGRLVRGGIGRQERGLPVNPSVPCEEEEVRKRQRPPMGSQADFEEERIELEPEADGMYRSITIERCDTPPGVLVGIYPDAETRFTFPHQTGGRSSEEGGADYGDSDAEDMKMLERKQLKGELAAHLRRPDLPTRKRTIDKHVARVRSPQRMTNGEMAKRRMMELPHDVRGKRPRLQELPSSSVCPMETGPKRKCRSGRQSGGDRPLREVLTREVSVNGLQAERRASAKAIDALGVPDASIATRTGGICWEGRRKCPLRPNP